MRAYDSNATFEISNRFVLQLVLKAICKLVVTKHIESSAKGESEIPMLQVRVGPRHCSKQEKVDIFDIGSGKLAWAPLLQICLGTCDFKLYAQSCLETCCCDVSV